MAENLVPLMPDPKPINAEDASIMRFLKWLLSMGEVPDE